MRIPKQLLIPLALCLLVSAALAPAAFGEGVATQFTLLAGFPESSSNADGVLVVPGTVIPLEWGPPKHSARDDARAVSLLVDNLTRTLRLADVEVLYRYPAMAGLGQKVDLPPPSATTSVQLAAVLRGFNDRSATYEVRITDGSEVLADTSVNVARSGRAVVGALNGDEAPYLFLAVEPMPGEAEDGALQPVPVDKEQGIQPPRAIERTPPQYTPEAREERIEGVVILQTVIDRTGEVREVEVLRGLAGGLTEAAVAAVRQWRFGPATDADGKPIDVYYNLTINFRLDSEKDAE